MKIENMNKQVNQEIFVSERKWIAEIMKGYISGSVSATIIMITTGKAHEHNFCDNRKK